MNDKIKLFNEQAIKYAQESLNDIAVVNKSGIMYNYNDLYTEKFAELIVAECLEACSRANEIRHFVPPTQEQVVLSCMREIEHHFGVEE
jgi:hypothetical protein